MKLNLHGALPEGWRDPHGVFSPEPGGSTLTPDDPSAACDRLVAAKATVDERLTAMLEKVKLGSMDPDDHADLTILAEQSSRLASELATAQEAADRHERRAWATAQDARAKKFADVAAEARMQRENFYLLFRETCLILGSFCASVDQLEVLTRESNTPLGPPPEMCNAIVTLTKDLNPMHQPSERVIEPTRKYGWNLSFPVVPLNPKGKL